MSRAPSPDGGVGAPMQQALVELHSGTLDSHRCMLALRIKRLIILRAPMQLLAVTSVSRVGSAQRGPPRDPREEAEAGSPRDDVGRVAADEGAVAVSPLSLQG